MAVIKVTCIECGEKNAVTAGALMATATADDLGTEFAGSVGWICSGCDQLVSTPVAWRVLVDLINAGVPLVDENVVVDLPPHPEHPDNGQDLTPDDLLEMHELLATDDWFSALAATPG
jgi:hypothetical protein